MGVPSFEVILMSELCGFGTDGASARAVMIATQAPIRK